MTKQKQVILDVIMKSDRHLTADDIYFEAKKVMPSIAIGTVYRNLNIMADAGEIQRIEIAGQACRFDKTLDKHEHFYCVRCGDLMDVNLPDIKKEIEDMFGTKILSFNLSMGYVCDKCKAVEEHKAV